MMTTILNDANTTGGTYRHELKPSERRDYSTAYYHNNSIKLMMDGENAHFPSHAVMETCMEIMAKELSLLIGNHLPAVSTDIASRARKLASGHCNFTNDADMYAFMLNMPVSQIPHGFTSECIGRALVMLSSLHDKSYFAYDEYDNEYCLIGQIECIASMFALGVSEDDISRTLNYACEPDNMLTRLAVIGKSYDAYTVMALESIMHANNVSTDGLLSGKPSDNEYIFDYCWYHSETELLARIAGEDWMPDNNLINTELPITLSGLKVKSWEQFDSPEYFMKASKHDDINSIPPILIDSSCVFSQMKAYDDVSANTCIALRARLNSLIGVLFDEIGYDANADEIIKLVNNLIEHSGDKDDDGNFIITNQLLSYPIEFIAQKLMTY
jgi:hypothetical protein